ncbi:HDOD domain-containing protein [Marinobacter fonticola]|uniref:HDOD domain-containing protein n=1 Tax=Marinobacter fonticola TaxID=2603215 RepID=UPI0011E848D3|nr:HDOD domain-containing protein [Marinobacter fonticola]
MWRLFNWLKPKDADQPATLRRESGLLNSARPNEDAEDATRHALRQLESHLFSWLLDATPAQINQDTPHEPVIRQALQERIADNALVELPRQPAVLPKLIRALSDENVSRHELSEIVLADPALTDQLLHVANSPFFLPGEQHIESVEQAIFLLGINGVRSVASAAVLRPMMTARNSQEALFAQRVWRWGLACARAAELIANTRGADGNTFFMVGLMPSLAYITLRREVARLYKSEYPGEVMDPAVVRSALRHCSWATAQIIATKWDLPPRYHAYLLAAERPAPHTEHTPLNDGIILGTREVLRHAHQRNLPEEHLITALQLDKNQFQSIRDALLNMLRDPSRPNAG